MLKKLFPSDHFKSIFDIDLAGLRAIGIRGIILDLDNTIIARNSSIPTEDLKQWIKKLEEAEIKACILSNNWKMRVSSIASQVNLPLVARAAKPRKGAFKRAMQVLGTSKEETLVVGDQIFTDIFGGNLAGLRTFLVEPVSNHEAIHTKFLRHLEKLVMRRWQKCK